MNPSSHLCNSTEKLQHLLHESSASIYRKQSKPFPLQGKHPSTSSKASYPVIHEDSFSGFCCSIQGLVSQTFLSKEHLLCFRHTTSHESLSMFPLSTAQNTCIFFTFPPSSSCTLLSAMFDHSLLFFKIYLFE